MSRLQNFRTAALAILLLAGVGSRSARSDMTYQVSIDTSALAGQNGNLDFQFNPGGSSAELAFATISNFQTPDGILAKPASLTGDASGSLPGTLMLDNGTAYNDIFQGFTYGSSFDFTLTLSGPALSTPGGTAGSSFALSLYDSTGFIPLLTTDPNGSVLTVNLNADGTASVETFPQSVTNNNPAADASLVNAVPEPSSMVLLISTLPFSCLIWYRARLRQSARNS